MPGTKEISWLITMIYSCYNFPCSEKTVNLKECVAATALLLLLSTYLKLTNYTCIVRTNIYLASKPFDS